MKKVLKLLLGILLLPALAGTAWTLWDVVVAWLPGVAWNAEWLWAFAGGVIAFTALFFLLPRAMWLYVLGHEFTHAICVWIAGGHVHGMHVSSRGGHVRTDKVTWWITLAPYFVPFYTLLWMALWWSIDFWYPLRHYEGILFFGIGVTYAFHVAFTISMMHPDQTDITSQGYVFSGVIILLLNLLLILAMILPMAADNAPPLTALELLADHVGRAYLAVGAGIAWASRQGWRAAAG